MFLYIITAVFSRLDEDFSSQSVRNKSLSFNFLNITSEHLCSEGRETIRLPSYHCIPQDNLKGIEGDLNF